MLAGLSRSETDVGQADAAMIADGLQSGEQDLAVQSMQDVVMLEAEQLPVFLGAVQYVGADDAQRVRLGEELHGFLPGAPVDDLRRQSVEQLPAPLFTDQKALLLILPQFLPDRGIVQQLELRKTSEQLRDALDDPVGRTCFPVRQH